MDGGGLPSQSTSREAANDVGMRTPRSSAVLSRRLVRSMRILVLSNWALYFARDESDLYAALRALSHDG